MDPARRRDCEVERGIEDGRSLAARISCGESQPGCRSRRRRNMARAGQRLQGLRQPVRHGNVEREIVDPATDTRIARERAGNVEVEIGDRRRLRALDELRIVAPDPDRAGKASRRVKLDIAIRCERSAVFGRGGGVVEGDPVAARCEAGANGVKTDAEQCVLERAV